MLSQLLLLSLLALSHARPQTDDQNPPWDHLEYHPDCVGHHHYLLPHEYDCTKFYYCEYGFKWKSSQDCAPGTEFSYENQVCVHPSLANCKLPGYPPSSSEAPPPEVTDAPSAPETEAPSPVETEAPPVIETEAPYVTETDAPVVVTTQVPSSSTSAPSTTQAPVQEPEESVPSTNAPSENDNDSEGNDVDNGNDENNSAENDNGAWLDNGCPADFDIHHLLPHENDCTKFYYCVFGDKVERVCPAGLHFNPVSQVCDWPENAGCVAGDNDNNGGANPDSDSDNNDTDADSGNNDNNVDENDNNGADNEGNDGWLDNGCPADFTMHQLLPHEDDCGKFYYCVFGEKVERNCSAGLHFNPVLQVCDWPKNAGCVAGDNDNNGGTNPDSDSGNNETDTDADTGNNDNNVDENDNNGADNGGNDGWLDNGCPADFNIHHLLPHEDDCGKFYYCVFGEKVERDCSAGLHFNPVLQVCDWPENAGCVAGDNDNNEGTNPDSDSSNNETDTDADTGNNDNNVDENDNNGADNGGNDGWLDNGCPADFNIHHLLPHEDDCGKFYYCVFGEKVERDCSSGLHFNPVLQVCDWPENAGCAAGDNDNNGGTNPDSDSGNNETDTDADTGNNDNNGDENDNNGADNGGNDGWLDNGCPADFNIHHLLPHEDDCGKFYYCVFGEKVERDCSAGLHFNPVLQVCDWPENAGCVAGDNDNNEGTNPDSDSSNNETDTDADTGNNDNNGDENDNNGADNGGNDGWLDNGCPADFNIHHLLPHEDDCGKFYYCVFGEKVERDCSSGLHFNPVLQVCDWPENAGCAAGDNDNNGGTNPDSDSGNNETDTDADTGNNDNNGDENDNNGADNGGNDGWLDNGCPADFNIHHLLPHEDDCGKFYYCVFGEKVERDCSAGLHFNPVLQVCDWPENAGCVAGDNDNNGGTNPDSDSGNNETDTDADTGNNDNNGDENDNNGADNGGNDGWLDNGCPADFNIHHLLPHEDDCGKFYYCVFGEKVERDCSSGLHFNPVLQVCDWPENAGCAAGDNDNNGGTNPDSDSGNNETDTDADSGNNDNNGDENNNSGSDNGGNDGWLDNGCPADFDVHYLLPHEDDCGKFYYCVFGEKVERDCSANLHFNPVLQVCDWPESAGCVAGDNDNSDGNNNGSGDNNDNGSGDNNDNGSGDNNDNTDNGSGDDNDNNDNGSGDNNGNDNGSGDDGPADGEENDNGSGDNDSNDKPDRPNPNEPDHSKCADVCNVRPWAHETACDKFWRCEGDKAVLVICSEGLHFNANTGTCDFICFANCERNHVQTTSHSQGISVFIPWHKVDNKNNIYGVVNE